ncbi:hypothetical protein D9M70_531400 [compost metagenome]
MGQHPENLRLSSHGQPARSGRRPRACARGAGAHLENQERNRITIKRPNRERSRLGHCPQIPHRRKPGTMEGAPGHVAAGARENSEGRASPRVAHRCHSAFHVRPASARRNSGQGAGVHRAVRSAQRRGARCGLAGVRPGRWCLDHPARANEGHQGAPRSIVRISASDSPCSTSSQRQRVGVPVRTRQAAFRHGDDCHHAPHGSRCRTPRVSLDISRLGERAHQLPTGLG